MKNSLGSLFGGLYVKFVAVIKHIFGIGSHVPDADRLTKLSRAERVSMEVDTLVAAIKTTTIKLYGPDSARWLHFMAHEIVTSEPDLFQLEDRYIALENEYRAKGPEVDIVAKRGDTTFDQYVQEIDRRKFCLMRADVQNACTELERKRSSMTERFLIAARKLQAEECQQILNGILGIERYKKTTRYEASYERRSDGNLWETNAPSWIVVTRYIFDLSRPDASNQDSIWLLLVTHTPIETEKTMLLIPVCRVAGHVHVVSNREELRPTGKFGPETVQFCTSSAGQMTDDELKVIQAFKSGRKKKRS